MYFHIFFCLLALPDIYRSGLITFEPQMREKMGYKSNNLTLFILVWPFQGDFKAADQFDLHLRFHCANLNGSIANNGVQLIMRFGTLKSHDRSHRCEQGQK